MTTFVVDPAILTVPDANQAAWFAAFVAWLSEVAESRLDCRHVYVCTCKLFELGKAPSFSYLRELLVRENIDANLGLIVRRLAAFFQDETRDLYRELHVKCAVGAVEPTIQPNELVKRNVHVEKEFVDALMCLASDRIRGTTFAEKASIITLPLSKTPEERAMTIFGTVNLVDPDASFPSLPWTVTCSLPLVVAPEELVPPTLSAADILAAGVGEFERVVSRLLMREAGAVAVVTVGVRFWDSLFDSGIATDGAALEKLIRVAHTVGARRAATTPGLRLRQVRESEANDSPQNVRGSDGARAWRVTITTHGIGWRMHYWQGSRSGREQIELCGVLRKGDRVHLFEAAR